jgi:hypothetical protein
MLRYSCAMPATFPPLSLSLFLFSRYALVSIFAAISSGLKPARETVAVRSNVGRF